MSAEVSLGREDDDKILEKTTKESQKSYATAETSPVNRFSFSAIAANSQQTRKQEEIHVIDLQQRGVQGKVGGESHRGAQFGEAAVAAEHLLQVNRLSHLVFAYLFSLFDYKLQHGMSSDCP